MAAATLGLGQDPSRRPPQFTVALLRYPCDLRIHVCEPAG